MKIATTIDASQQIYAVAISFFLNAASFMLLYFVMNSNQLAFSQAVISASVLIMSAMWGRLYFDENITILKMIGISLALCSILILVFDKKLETKHFNIVKNETMDSI